MDKVTKDLQEFLEWNGIRQILICIGRSLWYPNTGANLQLPHEHKEKDWVYEFSAYLLSHTRVKLEGQLGKIGH